MPSLTRSYQTKGDEPEAGADAVFKIARRNDVMLRTESRAMKLQPCQNLNEPAGINNIEATSIRPRNSRRVVLDDPRFISIWHIQSRCALL